MSAGELPRGTCRFCGCEERTPCEGGCAWTDDTQTLCTTCLAAAAVGQDLVAVLGVLASTPKAGLHIARGGSWDVLELDQQRRIVGTIRTWLDAVQSMVAEELGERARDNAEELDAIAGFLLAKCPDELAKGEGSIGAVVVRLLEPHVGSRILVPGGARA